jgi:hypothetical protein
VPYGAFYDSTDLGRRQSFQYNLKLSTHIRPPVPDSYSPGGKHARCSAEDETVTNPLRRLLLNDSRPRSAAHSRETMGIGNEYSPFSVPLRLQITTIVSESSGIFLGSASSPFAAATHLICPFYTKVASAWWSSNSSSRYHLPCPFLPQNRARHSTI